MTFAPILFLSFRIAGPYSSFLLYTLKSYLFLSKLLFNDKTDDKSFETIPNFDLEILDVSTVNVLFSPALTPLSPASVIKQFMILLLLPEKSIASFPIFLKVEFDIKPSE